MGVTRRQRMARRADKWWRSVYLTQLTMVREANPLTGWMGWPKQESLSSEKPVAMLDDPISEENRHG